MDVAGKKILVTGGAGFIGSHAVEALVGAGAKVTVLVLVKTRCLTPCRRIASSRRKVTATFCS